MGKKYSKITKSQQDFIKNQPIFFVGTARKEGTVNVSPKGMDTFKVVDENKIIWLNLTGSGNETAAHLQEENRMTIMFCSFTEKPLILRLYGNASIYSNSEPNFKKYISFFPNQIGARQIIEMEVDLVHSSCGFGVPIMDFKKERAQLTKWAVNKGKDGLKQYQKEKNSISIDGYTIE